MSFDSQGAFQQEASNNVTSSLNQITIDFWISFGNILFTNSTTKHLESTTALINASDRLLLHQQPLRLMGIAVF